MKTREADLGKDSKKDGIVELEITRILNDIYQVATKVKRLFLEGLKIISFNNAVMIMILNVMASPYTKVEESFNTQALHDLIFTKNLKDYDHLEFSGVVERSFIGVLIVYAIGLPWFTIMGMFKLPKIYYLVFGRILLGILNYYSQQGFRTFEYIMLENASFHLNFWGSRMIPNSFALLWTNLAFYFQLKNDKISGLISLGIYVFVAIVLRAEIAVLGKILTRAKRELL
jgi:alpha-1,6-mannosyltransferase